MRLITAADEQLFQTVTVAARLGKAGRLMDKLAAGYDEHWDDPEAGFRYALALLATLQAGGDDLAKHAGYTQAMEALDDVLDGDEGHWLGRYCRARLRTLLPAGYGLAQDNASTRDKAAEDCQELLARQAAVPGQPYFAATYALAAQIRVNQGDRAGAARLLTEAARQPLGPVPYVALGAVLSEPFLLLFRSGADLSVQAGPLLARLFPAVPAVRAALPAGIPG